MGVTAAPHLAKLDSIAPRGSELHWSLVRIVLDAYHDGVKDGIELTTFHSREIREEDNERACRSAR